MRYTDVTDPDALREAVREARRKLGENGGGSLHGDARWLAERLDVAVETARCWLRGNYAPGEGTRRRLAGMLSAIAAMDPDAPPGRTRGGSAAKDERNAEIVRLMKEEGLRQVDVARAFGMTRQRVYQIVRRAEEGNDE